MSGSTGSLNKKFPLAAGLGAELCLLPVTKHERCFKCTSQVNLGLLVHCYLCNLCFHMAPPSEDTELSTLWDWHQQAPGTFSQPVDLHSSMSSWTSQNSGIRLGLGCQQGLVHLHKVSSVTMN